MAHGERASRLRGKLREFWSRRGPPGGCARGPHAKRRTHRKEHRKERREARREEYAALFLDQE